jgi:hypothetical protein
MTAKEAPQPWYTKPIQVPLFVLLMGGLAGGGISDIAKGSLGIAKDTQVVDSTARADIQKIERKVDTVAIRVEYMLKSMERMERNIDRLHQGGED